MIDLKYIYIYIFVFLFQNNIIWDVLFVDYTSSVLKI